MCIILYLAIKPARFSLLRKVESQKVELDGDTAPEIVADHFLCPLTAQERTKLDFIKIYSLGQCRSRAIIYGLKCKVEHVRWHQSCCTRMS